MQRGTLAGIPAGYFTPDKMTAPDTVFYYLHGGDTLPAHTTATAH